MQATYACELVRQLKSSKPLEVHFLHVLPLPDTVSINAAGEIETCGNIDIQYVQRQKQIAEASMANLQITYGSQVYPHVQPGNITDSILQFAETNHVQLIVMGTRGAVGLQEALSGSEAQVVARRSAVPVLSLLCHRFDLQQKNYLLGGIIFGLGWALSGACPGPMVVNVGYGFLSMIIVFFFALVGTYLYGVIKERLPH